MAHDRWVLESKKAARKKERKSDRSRKRGKGRMRQRGGWGGKKDTHSTVVYRETHTERETERDR